MISKIKEYVTKQSTFLYIIFWVIAAGVTFSTFIYILENWFSFSSDPDFRRNIIPSALAMVGGIGGVGYLVIRYRERQAAFREEERVLNKDLEEKMMTAITMLGNKDAPSTRIAGVYMLADIADTQKGSYQQRVVDILCGYLRTEREKDNAVESTILNIFRIHLLEFRLNQDYSISVKQLLADDQLWCDYNIDLHGTMFCEVTDFGGATFTKEADFIKAKFTEFAYFREAIFTNSAYFRKTDFKNITDFQEATFTKVAYFGEADFKDIANFIGATFTKKVYFDEVIFRKKADFSKAKFISAADFNITTFTSTAYFKETTFTKEIDFSGVTFTKEADFSKADFKDITNFQEATFKKAIYFSETTFTRKKPPVFPKGFPLQNNGLPEGAKWIEDSAQTSSPYQHKQVLPR